MSSVGSPLDAFTPATRDWFARAFESPTPAQELAWPAIASGEHVLLSAPTGSGKTLAAFLWAIDTLAAERARRAAADADQAIAASDKREGISLVYISPLKALSYDVDRNLRVPLRGIGADLTVAVRSGDTPQSERQAMLRNPPDILITTPESLYLMLTGRAQQLFRRTRWCIIDEIHAVAATKRGSHMALTLERLSAVAESRMSNAQAPDAAPRQMQRIGLSATQNPLEEVAKFMVGPRRQCKVIDAGIRKPLDLQIRVPVESMANPGDGNGKGPLDPLEGTGSENGGNSIWPAMYPELLELIRSHHSTIIFVNARRGAERLALRLNELAAESGSGFADDIEIARAHHGSLSREERTVVEELLKSGRLPCLVATSSLELGIDMGAVDLVIQVESPKSVARGLQRVGRAGHNVGDISRGRIFPKFRADLLECAVVTRRMREGQIETTVVPKNALDVLAQQIVAIAAATPEQEVDGQRTTEPVSVDRLYELITATHSYAELSRASLENVLDMLDGRYPSSEFAELKPRIIWDRVGGLIRSRPGSRQLAVTNAGTIPDRGLYSVTLPDGRRVGELDEEMVYEARAGQTFLLGASTWRIEEIGRDRVIVTPAPGLPGAVPFWKGDGIGRPSELGEAIGAFSRWAVDQPYTELMEHYDLDRRAATNLLVYLREQQAATRVIPSDTAVVVERFRDEIGDWRVCVLSPYGGRVHSAWGLAISARIRDQLELEADAIWSDDGIIIHLPDAEDLDPQVLTDAIMIEPDEVEDLVVHELGGSALFGARFRENAARALLIPRAYPGKRTPLWQQRLKSQSLLEVARKYDDFPIVLETYRECLRDVLDVPSLVNLLAKLQRREISLVEVETPVASPFASSLLFDYVATYMYEGDTPNAERRAAALSLDRDLLRELLGQEELRDLIDPGALASVEDDLQWLSEHRQVATSHALHDLLRSVGDLTREEIEARLVPGVSLTPMLRTLSVERRAVKVRVGGEERWIDAADAGLYRDALGVVPPGGLPDAFLEDVERPLAKLIKRYALTHGPFLSPDLRARYGVDCGPALTELEREGELVQGDIRPGGRSREWCHPEILRRIRRASLAALRKEVEPVDGRALARFLPAWQGVDRWVGGGGSGAGIDRLRDVLVPLQGLALPPDVWEKDVLPRRCGAYSTAWLDQLCASGEIVWIGAGALGKNSGRVALYFRDDAALLAAVAGRGPARPSPQAQASAAKSGSPAAGSAAFTSPIHESLRERLAAGACFFSDLLAEMGELESSELTDALWDLVWAGEVTNDAFAPLRAPRLSVARAARSGAAGGAAAARRGRFSARTRAGRGGAGAHVQGRWSLTDRLLGDGAGFDPAARRRALAELLLERNGILTREQVLAEGVPGGFSAIYSELTQLETLGVARRGYFVEGLGGAQFAIPGAVERLREREPFAEQPLVISAVDPAQPYGAALPWPRRGGSDEAGEGGRGRRGPARVAGAYVVLSSGLPVLYLERSGKTLLTLTDADDERLRPAFSALVEHIRSGHAGVKRIALEKVDGDPVMGSRFAEDLIGLGFEAGPRRLTLSA
jgi:ATP-dependent helicase Lhr and Lhr-like helicase